MRAPDEHSFDAARRVIVTAVVLAAVALASTRCSAGPPRRIITLATTTSVGNSGLLDTLLPAFEQQFAIGAQTHLVGSGLALQMLDRGEVDAVISHAPNAEATALRNHSAWHYRKFMFNRFVIVGPPEDPAGLKGSSTAEEAMRRIADSRARFLSRGDQSGTHEREQELWTLAGTRPGPGRLVIAGAGMGTTLRVASETGAYTLTDVATFEQQRSQLRLVTVFDGGPRLVNTYAIIVDSAGPLASDAQTLADWLSDGKGREVIARFRVGADVTPFTVWPHAEPRDSPNDVPR